MICKKALKKALFAFLFAALVSLWSVSSPDNPLVRWVYDTGLDMVMRANVGREAPQAASLPQIFIDADRATCDEWRKGDRFACAPWSAKLRQGYLAALRSAIAARPAAIVLDIDLSAPSIPEVDAGLLATLNQSQVPIYIPRPIRTEYSGRGDPYLREPTPTIVDDVENKRVKFAHALWDSDPDGVIRRPISELKVTAPNGDDSVLPSIGLLVAADIMRVDPNRLRCRTAYCAESGHDKERRLVFAVDADRRIPVWNAANGVFGLLTPVSLADLLEREQPARTHIPDMTGTIVLIGSSRSLGGDSHMTPLGERAGSEVIANHIYALMNFDGLTKPDWYRSLAWKLGIGLAFTVLVFVFWVVVYLVLGPPEARRGAPSSSLRRLYLLIAAGQARRAARRVWRSLLRALRRGAAFAALYAILLLVSLALIIWWTTGQATLALRNGVGIEPLTPVLALLFEVTLEGAAVLLHRLERFSDATVDTLCRGWLRLFSKRAPHRQPRRPHSPRAEAPKNLGK